MHIGIHIKMLSIIVQLYHISRLQTLLTMVRLRRARYFRTDTVAIPKRIHSVNTSPFIYMAPLRGITDALYRKIYCKHFSGVDAAIAPFINPQRKSGLTEKMLADVVPRQSDVYLIPQILNSDGDDFLALANRLSEAGYKEVNWNLGCPVPMVAKKKRGSGLLPHPEKILALLDYVLPHLELKLSLKMRLGYYDFQESLQLLPLLDHYPLTEIIIHARLGKQLYHGKTYPEQFARCQQLTKHHLVYNGDITSINDYLVLKETLGINHFMIGRGIITDPFLPARIKGKQITGKIRVEQLYRFHDDLYNGLKSRLHGPGHLLGKMKQIWIYFIGSFPESGKSLKRITKASTEKSYWAAVEQVFSLAFDHINQGSNSSFVSGSASNS